MSCMQKQILKSLKIIRKIYQYTPKVGIILGSGLGSFAEQLQNILSFPYKKIPFFPESTVPGHSNMLVFGEVHNLKVVVMKGRPHYYEGFSMDDIVYPVRVLKEMGIKVLLVTNAAGAINPRFKPGDLMNITDHLNFMNDNPLKSWSLDDNLPRFIEMTLAYNPELNEVIKKVGAKYGIKVRQGVYAGVLGPSYETPAEIRMLDRVGADAVGMSTVPEVIVGNQVGLKVVGLSLLTNMAAGVGHQHFGHNDVLESSEKYKNKFIKLIKGFLLELSKMEI